jgi:hypothetical protein
MIQSEVNQSKKLLDLTSYIVTDKKDHQCVVKVVPLKMKILLKGTQPSVADVTLQIGM